MGVRQQVVYEAVELYRSGKNSREETALLLGVSARTVTRLAKRIRQKGMAGTQHGNKGKRPINTKPQVFRVQVIELMRTRYYDFSISHAHERITEEHHLLVCYRSLLNWVREAGMSPKRKRKASKARLNRERFANEGLLLQMDGSFHKWNGEDEWCLISLIDDATSDIPYAQFFDGETTWNCMTAIREVIARKGVPLFVYTDQAGWSARPAHKRPHFSQFKRACEELGITVIPANSPQAKGRIERSFKTKQGRLIPELRLNAIKSMLDANRYLDQCFLPDWRKRFCVAAREPESRYKPLLPGIDLQEVFCFKHQRVVANDHCIYFKNLNIQIKDDTFGKLSRREVTVHEYQDGTYRVFYGKTPLQTHEITSQVREKRRA